MQLFIWQTHDCRLSRVLFVGIVILETALPSLLAWLNADFVPVKVENVNLNVNVCEMNYRLH